MHMLEAIRVLHEYNNVAYRWNAMVAESCDRTSSPGLPRLPQAMPPPEALTALNIAVEALRDWATKVEALAHAMAE